MLAFEYGAVDRSDVTLTRRSEEHDLLVRFNNCLLIRYLPRHIILGADENISLFIVSRHISQFLDFQPTDFFGKYAVSIKPIKMGLSDLAEMTVDRISYGMRLIKIWERLEDFFSKSHPLRRWFHHNFSHSGVNVLPSAMSELSRKF